MEWEDRVKLVQLGNARHDSEDAKQEFQTFVLENISTFDSQAWDMFTNLSDLIVDDMKLDAEYWNQIYQHIKDVDCNDEKFGLRAGMRIALIQEICEKEILPLLQITS